jgi:acetolactate synthase-1/2/3 large subunit
VMCAPEAIEEHAALVAGKSIVLWLGFGARHAAREIFRLAEVTGARVISTPRGKGVFPEEHPQFVGVTGVGGHTDVDELFAADRPTHTLVLGSRLGESSSFWSPDLAPSEAFLHVDVDPAVFGTAYPDVTTYGAVADIASYCDALATALASRAAPSSRPHACRSITDVAPRADSAVRPQLLFSEIQRVIVEGSDAWMMAESGNAFCWAANRLRISDPSRYRVSVSWGSMGHAATSVTGVALARAGKAVAILGDGAMMMQNEVHAAVQHGAPAVWIVLNDATYLMCRQGMTAMGWEPFSSDLPRVDFVAMARAMGADGERVTSERDVAGALERAMRARGPWVIDVTIDPAETPPSGRRNRSLMQQGHGK